jgi:hypothetical protein
LAAVIPTVQVFPAALSQPPHPATVEPAAGVAVSVTLLPLEKSALQVGAQLMPAGVEVTVPVPVPAFVTVRV